MESRQLDRVAAELQADQINKIEAELALPEWTHLSRWLDAIQE